MSDQSDENYSKVMHDPREEARTEKDADIDQVYESMRKSSEFWIVVGRGAFAFRYGPYAPAEVGPILERSVKERICITVVGQMGRELDWELAKDIGMKLVLPGDKLEDGTIYQDVKKPAES